MVTLTRKIFVIIFILILTACAGKRANSEEAADNTVLARQETAIEYDTSPRYAMIPESPRRGDPVTVAVNSAATEARLFIGGQQISRSVFVHVPDDPKIPRYYAAIITIPSTAAAGPAVIRINNNNTLLFEIPFTIAQREFRSETLNLTPSLSTLLTEPDPQKERESARLWNILNTKGDTIYHTGQFVPPVTSLRRTSQFGTRRVNVYPSGRSTTSIHEGVDYGIPTGTEVYACGRGKVALATHRIITGGSVIIEHAPGFYSLYYHLSEIIAREGTIVEAGEVIALSGSTGFSTGPHLHWDIRINMENTDPDAFISRPIIDKEQLISKLFLVEQTQKYDLTGRR